MLVVKCLTTEQYLNSREVPNSFDRESNKLILLTGYFNMTFCNLNLTAHTYGIQVGHFVVPVACSVFLLAVFLHIYLTVTHSWQNHYCTLMWDVLFLFANVYIKNFYICNILAIIKRATCLIIFNPDVNISNKDTSRKDADIYKRNQEITLKLLSHINL